MSKYTISVIALILGAGLLTSCADKGPEAEPERVAIASTEASAEETQAASEEIEIEPKTEPEVNELIYDADNIRIYYKGFSKTNASLYIENNSDGYLHMKINDLTANKISFEENPLFAFLKPHEGGNNTIRFDYFKLQDAGITRVSEFTFSFKYSFTETMYEQWGTEEHTTEIFTITR